MCLVFTWAVPRQRKGFSRPIWSAPVPVRHRVVRRVVERFVLRTRLVEPRNGRDLLHIGRELRISARAQLANHGRQLGFERTGQKGVVDSVD